MSISSLREFFHFEHLFPISPFMHSYVVKNNLCIFKGAHVSTSCEVQRLFTCRWETRGFEVVLWGGITEINKGIQVLMHASF